MIITAGVGHKPGAPRLEYLKENACIVRGIVEEISKHNPCGILIVASNPVDVLTYGLWKWSGLEASRVLGSGTALDTSRFRLRLAEHCGMSPNNVHAHIIGEHGDSQVPVLSSARIGVPLEEFYRELQLPYDEEVLRGIASRARTAASEIIGGKGATYYGIASALVFIVNAILHDEHAVLTCLKPRSRIHGDGCGGAVTPNSRGSEWRPTRPSDCTQQVRKRCAAGFGGSAEKLHCHSGPVVARGSLMYLRFPLTTGS